MKRIVLVVGVMTCIAASCEAQAVRKSQLGTVSQVIGQTRIDIVYRRPVARGRDLFGGIVPFGRVWSPSADSAGLFTTSTDIEIAGSTLKAGRYSIWMIPDSSAWTVIFSSAQPVFHIPYPQGRDVLRVSATPRTGDHLETLAFYFPMVDADSASLNMHWGRTIISLPIKAR
jgi:hypothetical protein